MGSTADARLKVVKRHMSLKGAGNYSFSTNSLNEHTKRIEITKPSLELKDIYEVIFTKDFQNFLLKLVGKFDSQIDQVLQLRVMKRWAIENGGVPSFKAMPNNVIHDWEVDPIPLKLRNRKLDLGDISPANKELFSHALNSGVQGIQVDFDDGHCPSWTNQLQGFYNIYLAVRNQLPNTPTIDNAPLLMLRPRAWNMVEHNFMVNGREITGPLLDFAVLTFHNGRILKDMHSGPYFYLSKVESEEEARLWDDIFTWSENELNLGFGTIKSCVLIENILATFEMESILYALRHHSIGLNCGIWDYSASIISLFGRRSDFVISDRMKYVNIDQQFLKSYIQLLIQTCHKHGALATGGMAALILPDINDPSYESCVKRICDGKLKEIMLGLDGFMVHDLRAVPHINQLWKNNCPQENQLHRKFPEFQTTAQALLQVPVGEVSFTALEHNVGVAVLFIEAWLRGSGTFLFRGNVEDSATAEISRWQVWQWILHQVSIDSTGAHVTRDIVFQLADRVMEQKKHLDRKRLSQAIIMFKELVTARDPPIFFTTYLSNHSVFRQCQK